MLGKVFETTQPTGFFAETFWTFVNFFIHVRFFCNEKSFFKSMRRLAKLSKSVDVFFRSFLAITVFASKISWNCMSVTYNFCSFRPKRAFPRPRTAAVSEKSFRYLFLYVHFRLFFLSKSVTPRKTWSKYKLGFFFRTVFTRPGKTFASFISSLFHPPLETFHNRHEITQKYILN